MSTNIGIQKVTMEAAKKLLRIALVGTPNVGKSTLLNRLIFSDISCVSNKVHTTRTNILGVYTEKDTQLVFLDSPGVVTRAHVLRHHLEDSLLRDPEAASNSCDLIAVVVDASNLRDSNRLNRKVLAMLREHENKKSFLILNKTDIVKDKRLLLDIGSRLSEGHLAGSRVLDSYEIRRIMERASFTPNKIRPTSPHVIELDKKRASPDREEPESSAGFRNFSAIYSVSALNDEGIDDIRNSMMELAKPVDEWPHGPDFLTNQNAKEVVHSIIRGQVMDSVDQGIPYLVKYNYLQVKSDEYGSLHIDLELILPQRYMVGKLLGQHGSVIFNIINVSRESISKVLACDVKLNITVKAKEGNKK